MAVRMKARSLRLQKRYASPRWSSSDLRGSTVAGRTSEFPGLTLPRFDGGGMLETQGVD